MFKMNTRKRIKLKIADELCMKYLNKKFQDLKTPDRIVFYGFSDLILSIMNKSKSLKKIDEDLK